MGKKRYFLGLLTSLFILAGGAFSAGGTDLSTGTVGNIGTGTGGTVVTPGGGQAGGDVTVAGSGYLCDDTRMYFKCGAGYYGKDTQMGQYDPSKFQRYPYTTECLKCGDNSTTPAGVVGTSPFLRACNCNTGYTSDGQPLNDSNGTSTTGCQLATVHCDAGTYLPAGGWACMSCGKGDICPGGDFNYNASEDQGIEKCPDGYTTDEGPVTTQVQCFIQVDAGHYLPTANGTSENFMECAAGTANPVHKVYYGGTSICTACSDNEYSDAGAGACTACATGYSSAGTDHAGVTSCKTTCADGYIVETANEQCTLLDNGWIKAEHTVIQGEVSTPAEQCPADFRDGAPVGTRAECVKSDTRIGEQIEPDVPDGCETARGATCSPATCSYKQYYGENGDGEVFDGCANTEGLDCNQTLTGVTAAAGHYSDMDTLSCPACDPGYTSEAGATSPYQCTKECTVACRNPGQSGCPDNSTCTFNTDEVSTGTQNQEEERCSALQEDCTLKDFTCNNGYVKNEGKCDPVVSQVSYSCGNGSGIAPGASSVQYGEFYNVQHNTCTAPAGNEFAGWSDGEKIVFPGEGWRWPYTTDITFTAQWTPCAGGTNAAGQCGCGENTYPNGTGGCDTCIMQCAEEHPSYPNGTYNICGTSGDPNSACSRACRTSDVPNASGVNGSFTMGQVNECYATACQENFYLTGSGKKTACAPCVPNATCPGGTETFKCDPGFHLSDDGTYCERDNIIITLKKNGGSGTVNGATGVNDAMHTCQYGLMCTLPDGAGLERENYAFTGWGDSPECDQGVFQKTFTTATTMYACWSQQSTTCQEGKYYNGSEHVDCPAGMYCPGNASTPMGAPGCGETCVADANGDRDVTTDGGATEVTQCYVTCEAKVISNGTTTAINDTINYNGSEYPVCTYTANCNAGYIAENQGTADATCRPCRDGEYCPGGTGTDPDECPEDGWCEDGNYTPCPDGGTAPAGSTSSAACYKACPTKTGANGTITVNAPGTMHYSDSLQAYNQAQCTYEISCDAGYKVIEETQNTNNPQCTDCLPGEICGGGTDPIDPDTDKCPAPGTSEPNATSIEQCFNPCTGSEPDVEHATSVKSDGPQYYKSYLHGYPACTFSVECEDEYTPTGNGTPTPSCEQCLPGQWCPPDGSEPQNCPEPGTSDAGATAATDCYIECSLAGPITGGTLVSNASGTDDKQYWDGNAYPTCTYHATCNPGYVVKNQDTAAATCEKCIDGVNCPGGDEEKEPDECEEGFYCEDGIQKECPVGGTSSAGAEHITDCYKVCPASMTPEIAHGKTESTGNAHYDQRLSAYPQCEYRAICDTNYEAQNSPGPNPSCIFGNTDECPADHYCPPDGSGPIACPDGGKSEKGSTSITQCYKIFDPYSGFKNGTASAKCFFDGTAESGKYDRCSIEEVHDCIAGYWYGEQGAFACQGVDSGYYSPDGAKNQTKCPVDPTGGDVESDEYADSYTKCYMSCDSTFDHSTYVAAAQNNVYGISATEYAKCSYNVTCVTGYTVQNNNTEAPSCNANVYTVTLDKNGGTGDTPNSIQCTFDSGKCELPATSGLTRPGYSTQNKWCSNRDGTGTCYYAGQSTSANISVDGTGATLYAVWVPNVYTVNLDHQSANTDGAPETVYLKYATGWFSNSGATTGISALTTLPTKTGYEFAGYYSETSGGVQIVNNTGALQTSQEALTFTTIDPSTIYARWSAGMTTCAPGTYYTGTGTECAQCTENHYCPGGEFPTDSGHADGLNMCPNSGYSIAGSDDASDCYQTGLEYVATHGSGTQTCYYDNVAQSYSVKCMDKEITVCHAGYWLDDPDNENPDCDVVGNGYYSGGDTITRTQCPNGGNTESETSTMVQECFKTNLLYTAVHGSGTQRCFYTSGDGADAVYQRDCDTKVITSCNGGYWLANSSDTDCVEVQQNYYSESGDLERHACPADGKTNSATTESITFCYKDGLPYDEAQHGYGEYLCYYTSGEGDNAKYTSSCDDPRMLSCDPGYYYDHLVLVTDCMEVGHGYYSPDLDLTRYQCPPSGTTRGTTSVSASECYMEGLVCDIENGIGEQTCNYDEIDKSYTASCQTCIVTNCNEGYSQVGNTCVDCPPGSVCDEGTQKTCAELTNGLYTESDAGTEDVAYCYRECALEANALAMTGRDYYAATDTCAISRCVAGYTLENGQCVECPEGSFCDPDNPGGDKMSCADLGDGEWSLSLPGAKDESGCYQVCKAYPLIGGTAIPVNDKAFYPNECEYEGRSETGNPCEIIDGVCVEKSCVGGFIMQDGKCVPCDVEYAITYKPTGICQVAECVIGFHPNGNKCESNIQECTAPNAVYAEREWDFAKQAFGTCTIRECDYGFHLSSNACVADAQPCYVENGTGYKEWDYNLDDWGECVAVSCNPGYTNDPSETNERTKQCGECKNRYSVLGKLAASSYVQGCEIASCMYQGELYNLEYNECVPICPMTEYEDETGTMIWDDSRKRCVRTCKDGYTIW